MLIFDGGNGAGEVAQPPPSVYPPLTKSFGFISYLVAD
jgi:hypothetical protein